MRSPSAPMPKDTGAVQPPKTGQGQQQGAPTLSSPPVVDVKPTPVSSPALGARVVAPRVVQQEQTQTQPQPQVETHKTRVAHWRATAASNHPPSPLDHPAYSHMGQLQPGTTLPHEAPEKWPDERVDERLSKYVAPSSLIACMSRRWLCPLCAC
jgi:hypothetical protein